MWAGLTTLRQVRWLHLQWLRPPRGPDFPVSSPPGVFTAPVRGVYYIRFTANAPTDFPMSAVLYKNGAGVQLIAHEQSSGEGSDTASNGAAMLLEQGDTLSMQLWHNTQIWDNSNHHSTFSGFLLFPM